MPYYPLNTPEGDVPLNLELDSYKSSANRSASIRSEAGVLPKPTVDKESIANDLDSLHMALESGSRDSVRKLLHQASDLQMLLDSIWPNAEPWRNVFFSLQEKMPDVASEMLDKLLKQHRAANANANEKHMLYYGFLDNVYINKDGDHTPKTNTNVTTCTGSVNAIMSHHTINLMIDKHRQDLLCHPIVQSMISHKWRRFALWSLVISVLVRICYIALLTVVHTSGDSALSRTIEDSLEISNACLPYDSACCKAFRETYDNRMAHDITAVRILVVVLIAINLFQQIWLIYQQRLHYFMDMENLVNIAYNLLLIPSTVEITRTMPTTCNPTGASDQAVVVVQSWQWNTCTLGIMLIWISLVFFVRKLPHFGNYVIMFFALCKRFLNCSVVFILFLIAFGSALNMVYPDKNVCPYDTIWNSVLKVLVMATGEYSFENIVCVSADAFTIGLLHSVVILCLFCMTLVVMNMLVGLAVDDIQEMQRQASFTNLCMRARVAVSAEQALPFAFRKRLLKFGVPISYKKLCAKRQNTDEAAISVVSNEDQTDAVTINKLQSLEAKVLQLDDSVTGLTLQISRLCARIENGHKQWHFKDEA